MIFITSYCSPSHSIIQAVEELVKHGFSNIELTGGTDFDKYSENRLIALQREHGLNFLIHNFFPPQEEDFVLNLATVNRKTRHKSLGLVRQAIALSEKFSQNLYSVHAGYTHDRLPIKGSDGLFLRNEAFEGNNSREIFFENLAFIAEKVLPRGFKLAVENAFPHYGDKAFSFLSSDEDIFEYLQFAERFSNLGFLLDLGHLNVASYYGGFDKKGFLDVLFSEYSSKIFEIHVSRNSGREDSHKVSDAKSYEIGALRENIQRVKDIPIVMEWHQSLSGPAVEQYMRVEAYLST